MSFEWSSDIIMLSIAKELCKVARPNEYLKIFNIWSKLSVLMRIWIYANLMSQMGAIHVCENFIKNLDSKNNRILFCALINKSY